MTKQEILTSALTARDQEIMEYQINIDNYATALRIISDMPEDERVELADYSKQLEGLLHSSKLEQKKTKVIRDAIAMQIEVD